MASPDHRTAGLAQAGGKLGSWFTKQASTLQEGLSEFKENSKTMLSDMTEAVSKDLEDAKAIGQKLQETLAGGAGKQFDVNFADNAGLGLELDIKGGSIVRKVTPGGQAEGLGVKAGDRLVAVAGKNVPLAGEEGYVETVKQLMTALPRPVILTFFRDKEHPAPETIPAAAAPASAAAQLTEESRTLQDQEEHPAPESKPVGTAPTSAAAQPTEDSRTLQLQEAHAAPESKPVVPTPSSADAQLTEESRPPQEQVAAAMRIQAVHRGNRVRAAATVTQVTPISAAPTSADAQLSDEGSTVRKQEAAAISIQDVHGGTSFQAAAIADQALVPAPVKEQAAVPAPDPGPTLVSGPESAPIPAAVVAKRQQAPEVAFMPVAVQGTETPTASSAEEVAKPEPAQPSEAKFVDAAEEHAAEMEALKAELQKAKFVDAAEERAAEVEALKVELQKAKRENEISVRDATAQAELLRATLADAEAASKAENAARLRLQAAVDNSEQVVESLRANGAAMANQMRAMEVKCKEWEDNLASESRLAQRCKAASQNSEQDAQLWRIELQRTRFDAEQAQREEAAAFDRKVAEAAQHHGIQVESLKTELQQALREEAAVFHRKFAEATQEHNHQVESLRHDLQKAHSDAAADLRTELEQQMAEASREAEASLRDATTQAETLRGLLSDAEAAAESENSARLKLQATVDASEQVAESLRARDAAMASEMSSMEVRYREMEDQVATESRVAQRCKAAQLDAAKLAREALDKCRLAEERAARQSEDVVLDVEPTPIGNPGLDDTPGHELGYATDAGEDDQLLPESAALQARISRLEASNQKLRSRLAECGVDQDSNGDESPLEDEGGVEDPNILERARRHAARLKRQGTRGSRKCRTIHNYIFRSSAIMLLFYVQLAFLWGYFLLT